MPLGIDTRDVFVRSEMVRGALCVAIALVWSFRLHAEEGSRIEDSAIPGLQLDALSATRERPLFIPERRKLTPPSTALSSSNEGKDEVRRPQRPQLVLTGIIVSSSQTIVVLHDPNTSESISVRSGDTVGPWRVLVDSDHSVKLQGDAAEFELNILAEP
jgi:hypothetical protein